MAAVLARSKISVTVPASDADLVAMLESMACGLAVVASDPPANRQWITRNYWCPRAMRQRWPRCCNGSPATTRWRARRASAMPSASRWTATARRRWTAWTGCTGSFCHDRPRPRLLSVIALAATRPPSSTPLRLGAAPTATRGLGMEVLIADGLSDDARARACRSAARTRAAGAGGQPSRIVSTGLNALHRARRGAVDARLDIHTRFAPITWRAASKRWNAAAPTTWAAPGRAGHRRHGADHRGGLPVPLVRAARARATRATRARSTPGTWAAGDARRSARFGLFDEALVRNQDDEHNLRLRLGSGRIWQSGTIRSVYHPRGSLRHLYAQQQQYGYWRPFVVRARQPGSLRQLVPALFVAAPALCALAALDTLARRSAAGPWRLPGAGEHGGGTRRPDLACRRACPP